MDKNRLLNIMEYDIEEYEDIVLGYIIDYLNKNRYIELEILIPYINSRITKDKINLNEEGIVKILQSLFQQNLIAEGSKLTKNEVLKSPPIRKEIYDYIKSNPGVYYFKIVKEFNLGNQTATWHLEMLLKFGFIKEMKIDNNHIYYESSLNAKDIEQSFYLSNEKVKTIVEYLNNDSEGYTKSELSRNLKMHLNTVKKYLKKLVELKRVTTKKISNKTLYSINKSY
ncbi:MAG: hypothetical protein ACFFA0_11520 [Promethearchaeota archaeon]